MKLLDSPFRKASFVALLAPFALSGCAKGPAGGAVNPSADRLSVTMSTLEPINNGYFYDFAFDDDGDSSDGPVAIVASTNFANGIVGGSFTVLVQYSGGAFTVYKRTDNGNGTETLERAPNPFVTPPSAASGNTISFTLNLDATTSSGARLFSASAQQLDMNFVTANQPRRDPNDNLIKAFDAFGDHASTQYATFDIRATRTFTNAGTVNEPTGDVISNDTSGAINVNQLDIADFSISVVRG